MRKPPRLLARTHARIRARDSVVAAALLTSPVKVALNIQRGSRTGMPRAEASVAQTRHNIGTAAADDSRTTAPWLTRRVGALSARETLPNRSREKAKGDG
jgi:hypothetical protein